jgi:hypothetical protein
MRSQNRRAGITLGGYLLRLIGGGFDGVARLDPIQACDVVRAVPALCTVAKVRAFGCEDALDALAAIADAAFESRAEDAVIAA